MKKFTVFGFLISFSFCVTIQAQNRAEVELIKSSGEYYYGEATASSSPEASDLALSYLTQSIAVQVSSTFQSSTKEKVSSGKSDFDEVSENILKTYSTATLKNVETKRFPVDGKIQVFHYIKKSEVAKIFEERKKLVFDIFEQAQKFEEDYNFGYALKWYYFGIILMNSIPEQNIIYRGRNLSTELSAHINEILQKVRFTLTLDKLKNDNERELFFSVSVDGKPAQYLEFNFFDGYDLVNSVVTDGRAIMFFTGSSTKLENISLNIRYEFYESREEIKEVGQLWDLVSKPSFKNIISLDLLKQKEALSTPKKTTKSLPTLASAEGAGLTESFAEIKTQSKDVEPGIQAEIATSLQDVLSALKKKDISSLKTKDKFLSDKLSHLMKYNGTMLIDEPLNGKINKTYDGFEYRKVSAVNKYSSLSKQSQEYLVFDFNEKGNLTDVNYGIIDGLYQKFVEQAEYGNDWGERQVIIKFMERYRTAYMTRNMEMLNELFADEAVIIVGRVLTKGQQKKNYDYVQVDDNQPDIEYLKFTKDEYLKRQKQVFNGQKDIYLGFSNFAINRKNNQDGVYGITLRQNYTATNYGDEGYLFLLVDFNEEKPQIYVRSWQPQEWSEESLVKMSNYNVHK